MSVRAWVQMTHRLFPPLSAGASQRVALRFPDRSLTYAELRSESARVARAIAGATRVAVLAEPRIETCVGVLGALTAGVPIVLVNPKSGSSELTHIINDARPDALIVAAGTEPSSDWGQRPMVPIELGLPDVAAGESSEPPVDAPALIIYTSGTTGPPKGVVLPRRAIASNLDALAEAWAWTDADVVAHALPLFHVHGLVLGILGPVRRGGTARHLGTFAVDRVELALTEGATMLFGVPTMYRRLAEAAQAKHTLAAALRSARLLVSGSAALPAAEHRRLEQVTGQRVVERYGMTETLMNTAIRADGDRRAGCVGPPLHGVDVRLVNDEGDPLPGSDGETIGEIEVRGPNLFLEYLNRPDATSEAMHDRWFRTGDLATRSADQYLKIVGRRATDLIKSGGYKIGAGEIEAALREHPSVDDAAVTGEHDPDLGERVVAWIVLRPGEAVSERALIDHVAGQLAPHKRPRVVHFLAELPRNELGKVQKKRLKASSEATLKAP